MIRLLPNTIIAAMFLLVSLSAQAAGKKETTVGSCQDTQTIIKVAQTACDNFVDENGDVMNDISLSAPEFVKSSGGKESWSVPVNYNDSCYSHVDVELKVGTCEVLSVKPVVSANGEDCTDE